MMPSPSPDYIRGLRDAVAMLQATPQAIRLAAGEMTAQEMRTARAVLAWKRREVLTAAVRAGVEDA